MEYASGYYLDAANIGGDTDTIGAIAGAILGAALGVEVLDGCDLVRVEEVSRLDLRSVASDLLSRQATILEDDRQPASSSASFARIASRIASEI